MAGESQETPDSAPDPSVLTTEQMLREVSNLRHWMDSEFAIRDQRFTDMDKAAQLLFQTVNATPTEITKQIRHLTELMEERFDSTQRQFQERDTRQERESRDNKLAVDAAFAAQEKQAAAAALSNAEAREKSEKTTEKQLEGLDGKFVDLKDRTVRLETSVLTRQETRQETGASWGIVFGAVAALVAVMSLIAAVGFALAK